MAKKFSSIKAKRRFICIFERQMLTTGYSRPGQFVKNARLHILHEFVIAFFSDETNYYNFVKNSKKAQEFFQNFSKAQKLC